MKKLVFAAFMIIAVQAQAQWPWDKWDRIQGNGNLKKETRSVGDFTAVSSSGFWDVMISYGESNSIQIEGDENLLEYIETEVSNGRLSIRTRKKHNLRSKNKMVVYVSLTRLTGVSLSGSGDIIGKGKFRNDGNTEFRVSGSGSIDMNFDKVNSADVGVSGSGNIHLSGSAQSVRAQISGSGNADCSNLVADDASARISGSGNIKLNANKSVEASISGSGNISYRGSATDIRKHVAGSGRVVKH